MLGVEKGGRGRAGGDGLGPHPPDAASFEQRLHELVELGDPDHARPQRPGERRLLVSMLGRVVAGAEPVAADDRHDDEPPQTRAGAERLEVARGGGEEPCRRRLPGGGCVRRATTQSTPASAPARPSPLIRSTPSAREIGTTSPRAASSSTRWRPSRPVAPATATFAPGTRGAATASAVELSRVPAPRARARFGPAGPRVFRSSSNGRSWRSPAQPTRSHAQA